jgi:ATP-dependent Lon protease
MTDTDRPDEGQGDASQPAEVTPPHAAVPEPSLAEDTLIIVPVRNLVLFPGFVAPVAIGRPSSIAAAQAAVRQDRPIGVLLQRDPGTDEPQPGELHTIGTSASIVRYVTAPDGSHHIVCQGQQRFRVLDFLAGHPFLAARVQPLPDPETQTPALEARLARLKARTAELLELLPAASPELPGTVQGFTAAGALADFLVSLIDMKPEEKQAFLEILDLEQRADKLLVFLDHRIEVQKLSHKIEQQTKTRMDERQREFLLREHMKTIQQELGETDTEAAGLEELAAAIERAGMPQDVERHARKELKRLQRMNEAAAEYSMLLTYLEWLSELPWSVRSEDRLDIAEARRILDEDHCGLEKVKRRILEHLAVHKLNPQGRSPILCFVGPPGVGKTSLGQSIARATGRRFARVSLGGVHDEAEIRGHRRTYIGALPGNIIQAVRKAGTRNCVIMLDEMDKLGAGIHGDPAAALLEVLDPEQNATFRDNYLGVSFDLSAVMFIGTANVMDTVPGPLRDRMEVIELPGYTEDEKTQIAQRFLVPRQFAANGLGAEQCRIDEDAIRALIRDYTREAGVRNLEREIGRLVRHAAVRLAEGSATEVKITAADLQAIVGPARFESEIAMRTSLPGVATGLAWTPVGGDILFIEASLTPGSGKLILTGHLGDVMKESAQAALTLVKGHAKQFELAPDLFDRSDIHIHVPAGAIPKDGPSAGVSMFIALASVVQHRPVRADRAMTGEISLRGLVLPVGGIKEKVLAALRAGIRTVLLPARNRKELEEIPPDARRQLQFVWLETVEDALREALVPAATAVGTA